MRLRWLLAGCLALAGCTGDFPDDEEDSGTAGAGGAGAAGGAGGAGAAGGAGGVGGVGGAGGVGGMGGAGGVGGMGGAGGMVDPNGCEAACARLADCAAGEDWCPDLGPGDSANVAAGCLQGCTPDLAVFVTGAAACDDFMALALSFSGELFDSCGEPLPDGVDPNCIAIAEASCDRYGECGAVADDGMGNLVPYADICDAAIRAISVGLAACGTAADNYSDQGAVDACIGAIGQVDCGSVCSGNPVSAPAACNGVINVDPASFQCE